MVFITVRHTYIENDDQRLYVWKKQILRTRIIDHLSKIMDMVFITGRHKHEEWCHWWYVDHLLHSVFLCKTKTSWRMIIDWMSINKDTVCNSGRHKKPGSGRGASVSACAGLNLSFAKLWFDPNNAWWNADTAIVGYWWTVSVVHFCDSKHVQLY